MNNELTVSERKKVTVLRKMIGKEVRVIANGSWTGSVLDVLDHESFLISKNGSTTKVNVFDVRSL